MVRGDPAAGAGMTWLLAIVFTVVIGTVITHSRILWGPLEVEDTRDVTRLVFAQTYQAARAVYAPRDGERAPVALLGNSRIWLAARPSYLEPALARYDVGRGLRVENLGIFGADVRDLEPLGRHVPDMTPAIVVICLGASDLLPDLTTPWPTLAAKVFDLGWRDGLLPPADAAQRVDRWLRTAWPLYRFREMARTAIEERVVPAGHADPFPAHFTSTAALFDYMHGGAKGAAADAAYEAWRRRPTLAAFVAYLEIGSAPHLAFVRQRARDSAPLDADSLGARLLDALLAGLASAQLPTVVVLMPENPILAEDTRGEYHRPGLSDTAARLVETIGARHATRVVDARHWMPADAFLDFDHLLPDLSGFQRPLAAEIADVLS